MASLLSAAFFSGVETAYVTSNKLRMELDRAKYSLNKRFFSTFIEKPGLFSATMMVGNLLSLVVFSFASALLITYFLPGVSGVVLTIFIQATISTIVFLLIGHLLPKIILNANPNRILNLLSFPIAFFFYLLYPLSRISLLVMKYLSGNWFHSKPGPEDRKRIFHKMNHDIFTREIKDSIGKPFYKLESEIKLFKNALDFSKVRVRDCMIQRPDIEIMEDTATIEQLREKFIETGFSKILVYKNHIDNIIGYVHSFDLFNNPENIESCLRKVSFVPETMEAKKLLSILLKEHKSIAVVVDEFGGTAGMITTEDILEEIFGEIEDEHDKPDIIAKKIDENRYIFSGRLEIESINEMYHLNLQQDNSYETIAGYILYHHPSFPKSNSILQIAHFEFRILRSTKTSIELVEMRVLEK